MKQQAKANESERGAQIIKLAVQIMESGQARGWSDALSQAKNRQSNDKGTAR
jgi:hypothetical protein